MVEVIITHSAQKQRSLLLQYIHAAFGQRVAQKTYDHLESYIPLLAANPRLGALEPLLTSYIEGYRSLVVQKYTKLVYYIDVEKQVLYVTDFWDTRREPSTIAAVK